MGTQAYVFFVVTSLFFLIYILQSVLYDKKSIMDKYVLTVIETGLRYVLKLIKLFFKDNLVTIGT